MISNSVSSDPFSSDKTWKKKPNRARIPQKPIILESEYEAPGRPSAPANQVEMREDFLRKYLVNRCINCTETNCLDAHADEDQRRVPVLSSTGWSYKPILCLSRQSCQYGRMCRFAHNEVEILYHPLMFKTQLCTGTQNSEGSCSWGGQFCPRAHVVQGERACRDLHSLKDYGLQLVQLETTLQEQLAVNRRYAATSATYKPDVKRVTAADLKSSKKGKKAKKQEQPEESKTEEVEEEEKAEEANEKPRVILCMKCRAKESVFPLICQHAFCGGCLDLECPLC